MWSTSESTNASEYIMNQINLAARLAQGFLAVTVVFAIGVVFQLGLRYEGRSAYVAAQETYALPHTAASRVA
jgi:hypothetical protein